MLAHNKPQSHGGRSASRTQTRRPTQFMFIDSSNGGVNAKPDKTVRSFVMKSARNRKTWSTRPRSPRADLSSDTKSRQQSSFYMHDIIQHQATIDKLPGQECPTLADTSSHLSPNSTKSDSVFSCNSTDYSWDSLESCSTSPCMEYQQVNDTWCLSHLQQKLLPDQYALDKTSLGPFDCLAVSLDVSADNLLRQCKYTVI
jgi:hypothetical protein